MDRQSPGSSPTAQWYPDPRSRHEFRYWDGAAWTDHVADGGQTSVDPVNAPPLGGDVGQPAQAVVGQPAPVIDAAGVQKPGSRARRGKMSRRTRVIVLCGVVLLAGAIVAGVVLNQRHQHAVALAREAKAADNLGSDFDSVVTDYTAAVAAIEPALAQNATAVKAWKKEWVKRKAAHRRNMAAYRRKVAAVKAYNSSRWIPNVRTVYYEKSRPGYLLYLEPRIPSGDVWWSSGGAYDSEINGVLTRRPSRPKGPARKLPKRPKLKAPAKIQDPVGYRARTLERLMTRLDTLTDELDSAEFGPEFLPVADEIRSGIELLEAQVDLAEEACRKAVRRDPRMGYVAVHTELEGVDVTVVDAAVQDVRDSLISAAQTHDVDLSKLEWAPAQP